MAKARTKTKTATAETPTESAASDVFDQAIAAQQNPATPIVQAVAESTRLPDAAQREAAHENGHSHAARHQRQHAPGHIANPSSKRREGHAASVRKLPSKLGITAGDLVVRLIDKGDNMAGIGIRVDVPEGRTLTDDEKQIIRHHVLDSEGEQTGFSWAREWGIWHKHIARDGERLEDIPPARAVAIRLDAESRVEKLAEAMKQHQADPVGYAERIRQEREQAASGQGHGTPG